MPTLFHGYGAVDVSSCAVLAVAQGVTVVLPRRPRRLGLRISHAWAAVLPPAAFFATVLALVVRPSLAAPFAIAASVAVPVLGALAMAAFARGGRPPRALLVVPLGVLAALNSGVAGELAILGLVMLSAVALGSLLAGAAPMKELAIGAVLLAVLDLALVHSGEIRIASSALLDVHVGLPDFAQPQLGARNIGYGDFFVAALAGAVAASTPSRQTLVALATTGFALLQYALSSSGDLLPATVPVAVALLLVALVTKMVRYTN
jgi:hypothetical protein